MGADALAQMKEWLSDEVENRTLYIATLKGGAGDASVLADKEAALGVFQAALAAAGASEAALDAFLGAQSGNAKSAAIAKMWQSLKG